MLTPFFGQVLAYAPTGSDFYRFRGLERAKFLEKIARCARHNGNNGRRESRTHPGARPQAKFFGLPGVTAVRILTLC